MTILILTDGCNWIVDRITDHIIKSLPDINFIRKNYTKISTQDFIKLANEVDIIHYNNWDISYHLHRYQEIKKPFLYTVRSFRYPPYAQKVAQWATKTLVIHPDLLLHIPNSVYIPDGVFDEYFTNKKFVVGYAGKPDAYKGFHLIQEACNQAGVVFEHADNIPPAHMPDWYDSIDLYVCMSIAEGHSTPVMEAMARNIPVITPKVGIPGTLGLKYTERNVTALKEEILKHYTQPMMEPYKWSNIIPQIESLYKSML